MKRGMGVLEWCNGQEMDTLKTEFMPASEFTEVAVNHTPQVPPTEGSWEVQREQGLGGEKGSGSHWML